MDGIYLDYNATTPIDNEVAEFMIPLLRGNFGNPSSLHRYGIESRKLVEESRIKLARLINCKPYEIIFTSGGTESNNIAIHGIALAAKDKGNHIITTKIEHPSVLEVCRYLERNGFRVSYIGVDTKGRIDPELIRSEIQPETILITVMHANNETGVIQPVEDISLISREFNIPFHTDAAQTPGKIDVDTEKLGVDLLSIAGHKFYAPKGIGALYIREGIRIDKILFGANHEHDLRPGTENVLEIAGLGKAAEIAYRDLETNAGQMKDCRDFLFNELRKFTQDIIWNGDTEHILPNTLNISIPGLDTNLLLSELKSIAVSAGAACHAESSEISHVLGAMGIPVELARGAIRFSTGKYTDRREIEKAVEIISKCAKKIIKRTYSRTSLSGMPEIRLTEFTHGIGCACKISPSVLENILKDFPPIIHPDVLVGPETCDDAAVYKINDQQALVQTVDFFTPVLDDPYQFGAVAASNALSDIYAMGAVPAFALNIVAFPSGRLPLYVLKRILDGARSVCDEAGIHILGGHTIEDTEPKFGMVVSGLIHPDKVIRNSTALEGHDLILTKPIGTGILSSALKQGMLDKETEQILFSNMRSLNKMASELMKEYKVSACTDITGFGLTGHLKEMVESSSTGAEIYASEVPLLPGSYNLCAKGIIPGGTLNNMKFVQHKVDFASHLSKNMRILLSDAQTSGGLLIAIDPSDSKKYIKKFNSIEGNHSCVIGKIINQNRGRISIK